MRWAILLLLTAAAKLVAAQCNVNPKYQTDVVMASGWKKELVAADLTRPRGIILDKAGNLLVVDNGVGVVSYKVKENDNGGACLSEKKTVVQDNKLNHGIGITDDGKTLFASSPNDVYIYNYDESSRTASNPRSVITGMQNGGHITRTLFVHKGYLLVSQGSEGNLDPLAATSASGHSTIKAFTIANLPAAGAAAISYANSGVLLGFGLRNSVGLTVDKKSGKIWSVENSVDNLLRGGQEVWQDNPGEELNYHGIVSETIEKSGYSGPNHGYPYCVAVWDLNSLPDNAGLAVGDQIQVEQSPTTEKPKDEDCDDPAQFTSPRLTFQAHMAPLDSQFDYFGDDGGDGGLWVTFHGSWNRNIPIGYKLSKVPFGTDGEPKAAANEKNNYEDILWNRSNGNCQFGTGCFRPVSLAVGSGGRVYVTSDSTGEIIVLWSDAKRGGAAKEERDNAAASLESLGLEKWLVAAGAAAGAMLF